MTRPKPAGAAPRIEAATLEIIEGLLRDILAELRWRWRDDLMPEEKP